MILHREQSGRILTDCLIPLNTRVTQTQGFPCVFCVWLDLLERTKPQPVRVLLQRNFWLEPHPVSFFFFSQEENNLTRGGEKKKHKVKMTGKEWKNQASSDVWNVLLLIFHVRNT